MSGFSRTVQVLKTTTSAASIRGSLAEAERFEHAFDPLGIVSIHLASERRDVVAPHGASVARIIATLPRLVETSPDCVRLERPLRPVPELVTAGLGRPDVTLLEHLAVAVEAKQGRSGDRLGRAVGRGQDRPPVDGRAITRDHRLAKPALGIGLLLETPTAT